MNAFRIGRAIATASSWAAACAPAPTIVAIAASGSARWRAATPVAAAVRSTVIAMESIRQSGEPVTASNSASTPWIVGSEWRAGLPGKFALILAAK